MGFEDLISGINYHMKHNMIFNTTCTHTRILTQIETEGSHGATLDWYPAMKYVTSDTESCFRVVHLSLQQILLTSAVCAAATDWALSSSSSAASSPRDQQCVCWLQAACWLQESKQIWWEKTGDVYSHKDLLRRKTRLIFATLEFPWINVMFRCLLLTFDLGKIWEKQSGSQPE